jgi:hypothetical protein
MTAGIGVAVDSIRVLQLSFNPDNPYRLSGAP